jgi:putative hydrolase of the HAD superfamily
MALAHAFLNAREPDMSAPGFDHVETWIFDLDNTLYPASCRLFDQIDVRMGEFIANLLQIDKAEARRVQKDYFYKYGTTLRGLMNEHKIKPDDFLDYVHDIDHSPVPTNAQLATNLEALPGRKLVFTNGTVSHATNVMKHIGITHLFDGIFDIVHSDFIPKPERGPYEKFIAEHEINAGRAAMFEDIARNLEVPHDLGMTTVLVRDEDNEDGAMINRIHGDGEGATYVHHMTTDLAGFLGGIIKA